MHKDETDVCLTCDEEFFVREGHVCSGRRRAPIVPEEEFEYDTDAYVRDDCWGVNRSVREIYPGRPRGW